MEEWTIDVLPNGKITLAGSGWEGMTYVTRTHNLYDDSCGPTQADFVMKSTRSSEPLPESAQWTIVGLPNGKVGLQADNGLFLGSCPGCLKQSNPAHSGWAVGSTDMAVAYVNDPIADVHGQLTVSPLR